MSKTRPKAQWWSAACEQQRWTKGAKLITRKGRRRVRQRDAAREIRDTLPAERPAEGDA